MKPIISVDFDGVIHSYNSGWKGAHRIPDPPVPGALAWLVGMFEEDAVQVAIFSSRSKNLLGRMAMKAWLRKWIINDYQQMIGPNWEPMYLGLVEWIEWPWFKPAALLTIDDRAVTFNGTFPTTKEMLAFRPWYRRAA